MGVARRGTVYAGFELELVERSARWDAAKPPLTRLPEYITETKIVGIL